MPIVINGFFLAPLEEAHDDHYHDDQGQAAAGAGDAGGPSQWKVRGFEEAPLMCVSALTLTAMGCIVLFFYATPLYDFLSPIAGGETP